MDISALNNNLFANKKLQGVNGINPFKPVTGPERGGADGGNPFSNETAYVGLGIKDGAVQTSAPQLGKKAMPMRQIGIA